MISRSLPVLASVLLCLSVVSLAGETDPRLVGTWVGEKKGIALSYSFKADGTGTLGMGMAERTIDVGITWKSVSSEGDTLRIGFTTQHGKSDEIDFTFVDADTVSLVPLGSRPDEKPITLTRKP